MRCQSSQDTQQNVNSPAFNRLCYRPQQNPLPLWGQSCHAAGVRSEGGVVNILSKAPTLISILLLFIFLSAGLDAEQPPRRPLSRQSVISTTSGLLDRVVTED